MKRTWLVSDGTDCNIFDYLEEINENLMFRSPYRHLILLFYKEYEFFLEALQNYEILPMSEVLLALFGDEQISLFFIYKIRNESDPVIENYGVWTEEYGLKLLMEPQLPISSRRRNFRKHPIKYGTVIFKDRSVLNTNFDDILETPEFYFQQEMPIFYSLFQALNATIEINIYNYHGHGGINKSTGKLIVDGLVGDLYRKKIDISSGLYVSGPRLDLLKPLSPVDFWGLKFFLKKPSLSSVKNIYILTLSRSVWKASFAMVVLFVAAIYLALKLESNTSTSKEKNEQGMLMQDINISTMVLLCFEAVGQQG
ncbi:uncharacterized protein LOC125503806 [Dendroctonus ponderosae]|uniref:uncharacterized protein LOC125503805 n=1 Tax=Dendroctonus ponderosae TaxID=77166 RepID=UPI0020352809|nr:uncharacterized protein LOC125503805 [Dendroctonus ponderosae]XP_048520673.1 uncharacterized protein LOC125503806 [Dendroctonus ponderosae]